MLKNAKAKGNRRERQTIQLLEREGYACMKAGGSLGIWDIVAFGPDVRFVQVKSNRRPSIAEMGRMLNFKAPPGASKWLYIWMDRGETRIIPIP